MKLQCFCPDITSEEFAELDLKEFDLSGKSFYVSRIPMISHFPLNPEIKIEKMLREIEQKGYETVKPLFVIFADGLLMGSVMIEIVRPQANDSSVKTLKDLKLLGKNFIGPKYLVPKALKEFDRHLMTRKVLSTEFYFWYHSCRKCEKEKGSRTVILGKIK